MTIYGYRCRTCNQRYESTTRADSLGPCHSLLAWGRCKGEIRRDYSGISIAKPMQEHWNPTVDAPVTSMRDFREKLKIKGAEYSEMSGIETDYQPIDLDDTRALGITEEGLDTTNRHRVDNLGLPPIRV